MALIEEDAVHDALDGLIERRVVEDDVRGLAAEFERELLFGAREAAHDDLAHLRAAGEGHLRGERMMDHRRARFSGSADDVHDAIRQSGFLTNLAKFQCGDAGGLRRLQDDAIPRRERRGDLPREHKQREIPRDDLPHDAVRGELASGGEELQFIRPARVIKEMGGGHRHIEITRFLDRLPPIHRLGDGELASVILQQPRDAVEILSAFFSRQTAPIDKRPLRRRAGRIDIGGIRERDVGDFGLRGRIDRREVFARTRGNEAAIDEEVVFLLQLRVRRLRCRIKLPQIAKHEFAGGIRT